MSNTSTLRASPEGVRNALQLVSEICRSREIAALDDFVESCRTFAWEATLNVAILGRFKAGKSSFLNHLLGRELLPVGAIPVTTVITEIEYGPRDHADVVFKDGNTKQISPECIGDFISETENPGNAKQVARVRLELRSMARYRGIRFVDTPGLESVLEYNTEASLDWLPNVGVALVAVGVDPPFSQHDVELIRKLGRYTPNISLLLTKFDLLEDHARPQVEEFVRKQLARCWDRPVSVFPFSTRPGFEYLQTRIDQELLSGARAESGDHHAAILRHKIDSLLGECSEYLGLALKAAERDESEREQLRRTIIGEKQYDDTSQALRLIGRHAAGKSRTTLEAILRADEVLVGEKLLGAFDEEFPTWAGRLSAVTARFEDWLAVALAQNMAIVSGRRRAEFTEPIRRVSRHLSQSLQDFRNRLSERALSTLGVPLRTSETELQVPDPGPPDVRVGKIFDRNWELLSFLLPMWAIRGIVRNHFRRKLADAIFFNLSRLAAQWEELVNESILALEKEAVRRLGGLVATIDKQIEAGEQETPTIRNDLLRLEELRAVINRPYE